LENSALSVAEEGSGRNSGEIPVTRKLAFTSLAATKTTGQPKAPTQRHPSPLPTHRSEELLKGGNQSHWKEKGRPLKGSAGGSLRPKVQLTSDDHSRPLDFTSHRGNHSYREEAAGREHR